MQALLDAAPHTLTNKLTHKLKTRMWLLRYGGMNFGFVSPAPVAGSARHTHTHTPPRPTRVRTFILNSLVPRYRNVPLCAVPGWIFCYKFKFLIIICKKMFNLDINHVRAGVLGFSSTDIRPGGGRRSRSRWDDGCWMWVLLCVRSGDDELRFHHQGRENALEGRMAQRDP